MIIKAAVWCFIIFIVGRILGLVYEPAAPLFMFWAGMLYQTKLKG